MDNTGAEMNADRFRGFAKLYDDARPTMPLYLVEVIIKYLGRKPQRVVDLGCGTGLSTLIWRNNCDEAVGIEPSGDMLAEAQKKAQGNITFKQGFGHDTGLKDGAADAVVCSQSFHWMEPGATLAEINRILKHDGIFATVDCDWPPVCNWKAEKAFEEIMRAVKEAEDVCPELKSSFKYWDKNRHLENIKSSGYFRFAREIVFSNKESCDAERFINLALSQGGLQSILKAKPELITPQIDKFKSLARAALGERTFKIDFGYRMRIGVK
ncbi:MAG: class I SAM-dependent methyltransferase [Burkholderiales bacterium]